MTTPEPEVDASDLPLRRSEDTRVRCYSSQFADVMEMRAPAKTVAAYLDRHEGWFRRCAAPMEVNSLGQNGYRLTLGRFGNFGFEVEPTIGLELLPQSQGVYRICTVPPEQFQPGLRDLYDVEFNAALRLEEQNARLALSSCLKVKGSTAFAQCRPSSSNRACGTCMTWSSMQPSAWKSKTPRSPRPMCAGN